VLAIPTHRFDGFAPALVADKLVVDTMNYWPPVDGVQELFEDRRYGSSEIVQHRLASTTVVKTLNHLGYHELEDERRPVGSPDRRALGVAGDDADAVDVVAEVVERIGYDAVRLDSLSAGRRLEPGGPVFGVSLRRGEFERAVHAEAARNIAAAGSPSRTAAKRLDTLSTPSPSQREPDELERFPLVFGLDTFGDVPHDDDDRPLSHAQTIRHLVEEGVLAERVGVDFFGIGEHHTDDFPLSAADVVLGAIAARTSRMHLGSAVTVLSSDDPVRVFQRYSTLDAVSGGRAEVILGRGSSIESFPLFGYDLADYEDLFEEKTDLFAELVKGGPVTWQGKTRPPLSNQDVVPHAENGPFPVWLGVGGSPQSVIRAARHGFSLMLAIIGGSPARFAPFSALFREALERYGHAARPVGVHLPGHVAATDEQAREEFWPRYEAVFRRVGKTRGFAAPTKQSFLREIGPQGALHVGAPQTVAQKIADNLTAIGASRFDLKYGMVGLSPRALMTNIELYGTQVIPRVRELLAR
jgi:probable LLM family oxidoreductase